MAYKTPKKIQSEYNKIHKEFCKTLKLIPAFFSHYKIPKFVKNKIEEQFPEEHYGNLGIFEAWDWRSLLEQAFLMGYHAGAKPKELNRNIKKIQKLSKQLDKFKFKIGQREFSGVGISEIKISGENTVYVRNNQEYQTKIPMKDLISALKKWENKFN